MLFQFSGLKSFWRSLDKQPVIDNIRNLNGHSKVTSITCYDF